jgi:hypothetical protein
VTALIDRLTDLGEDFGYSDKSHGTFIPLGLNTLWAATVGAQRPESCDPLRLLVQRGTEAVPGLLAHLDDERPTRLVLASWGGHGGVLIDDDVDEPGLRRYHRPPDWRSDRRLPVATSYRALVGDLCFAALGQIVNRDYWGAEHYPRARIYVFCVPKSKRLRGRLVQEWQGLTPDRHRASLARDLDSGDEATRNGASLRLAYYYPAAFEPLALEQLARATYPHPDVDDFVRNRLYRAKTPAERRALVEEFGARHGAGARDGIRWALLRDLATQEAAEGRRDSIPFPARECLVDVFGLLAGVTSRDRPERGPVNISSQARFVQTLCYDPSTKLDRALRDLLARTDDDYVARGCLDRLVGRGYDAEIEAYLRRRLNRFSRPPHTELQAYEARLGWTRLHAAAHLGVPGLVARALGRTAAVDARGRDGRTALHLAAAQGNPVIVGMLLDAHAATAVRDNHGQTPLALAEERGRAAVIKLLKQSAVR